MSQEIRIHLQKSFFGDAEKTLAEHHGMTASTFRYGSGVHALRVTNPRGEIVVLPFQGQQIWDAVFDGRSLTMKSMFREPAATTVYLETYGAFLVHCGAVAMGVPTKEDSHPLHGELPNAPYQTAELILGTDARGDFIAVTGSYEYTVAFSHHYVARPVAKLYADSTLIEVSLTVENLKRTPMELMYLSHANFQPVDNGRLVYSAHSDPRHVRVRQTIPSHIRPAPGYKEFLDELAQHPERHHVLKPGMAFDPEVVFFIEYLADESGWAHSLQIHPDGSSDVISHRPKQLDHGVRWISRTPDQDCLGIILPATAEPEGYSAEKAKGNLKFVAPGATWNCEYTIGMLMAEQTKAMEGRIQQIIQNNPA